MNRFEVFQFLRSFFKKLVNAETDPGKADISRFFKLIISLKRDLPLSIPILRELAQLWTEGGAGSGPGSGANGGAGSGAGILKKRIDRRYLRLCRIQEELGTLDFRKAAPGAMHGATPGASPAGLSAASSAAYAAGITFGSSTGFPASSAAASHAGTPSSAQFPNKGSASAFVLEDFVFSQIDFSRYRVIEASYFESLFPEGPEDFDEAILQKKFGMGREEIKSLIKGSYEKNGGSYKIHGENPFILSVMRTLETSLESLPLFTAAEIRAELRALLDFAGGEEMKGKPLPRTEKLYPLLVAALNGVKISHSDGMTTKLLISEGGELSGIFRPADKPWTRVLIPARLPA